MIPKKKRAADVISEWEPVFGKNHAQTKKLDRDPDQLDRIMV
jgi:hypothetical protein